MTAEQLEELLGRLGTVADGWRVLNGKYGPQIHSEKHWLANPKCESCPVCENEVATLIALAPSLARRVIAAEKLVEALERIAMVDDGWTSDGHEMCTEAAFFALTAYREAGK